MRFTSATVASFFLSVYGASAFSQQAFVPSRNAVVDRSTNVVSARHCTRCLCPACLQAANSRTLLSATVEAAEETEEVPAEIEALDGIESPEEAHNAERPSRGALKKKSPRPGKSLDEFEKGQVVEGKVKTITSYGAFVDIGAATDGLLHISQLSTGYVSDVKEFLEAGQEVEVRIINVDKGKGQVALSLLLEEQEGGGRRQQRQDRGSNRRDDSAAVQSLAEKGFDSEKFVEGTVVSTVDFGAFVRIDVSQLNAEAEGEMDGLVHISALTAGRANSVTSIVNVDDKVQVRVKSITGRKVSLSMISPEDEEAKAQAAGPSAAVSEGAADWKESLEKLQQEMPKFTNRPLVVDLRK